MAVRAAASCRSSGGSFGRTQIHNRLSGSSKTLSAARGVMHALHGCRFVRVVMPPADGMASPPGPGGWVTWPADGMA